MITAGIEFGYVTPTAIVVIDGENELAYHEKTGMTISEVIKMATEIRDKHKVEIFYADPTQPAYIKEMVKNGLNVKAAEYKREDDLLGKKALAVTYAKNKAT